MVNLIAIMLIVSLQLSVVVHGWYITRFLSSKSNDDLKGFLITAGTNFLFGLGLLILLLNNPGAIKELANETFKILESSFFLLLFLVIQSRIIIAMVKRAVDPSNYRISASGKKLYKKPVLNSKDLTIFFLLLPFTFFIGAYLIVKLIFKSSF